jgi:hypothetical protein
MPHLDTSEILHKGEYNTKRPITIDGEAREVGELDDDTLSLAGEPEFAQPGLRDIEEAKPVGRLPHGPLRSIDPDRLMAKWQLMEQLNSSLQLNEWDLPDYIYRADLLDHTLVADGMKRHLDPTTTAILSPTEGRSEGIQEIVAHINAARVELVYHEGFPALENGMPFWQQLPFETVEAYTAFTFYLEQGGARKMTDLIAWDLGEVKNWFHTYFWNFRVKAFDLYRSAHATRTKLTRMLSTEDDHFKLAAKLMQSLGTILEGPGFKDKLEALDADKAIGVLEKLVKVQRISVGLPANGSTTADAAKPVAPPTTNIIMQQITEGHVRKEETNDFDMLTEDPALVEMAQNLIIESQKKGAL